MIQGTDEWFAAKLGKVSGSRINDAVSFLVKGGESEKQKTYKMELIAERLTGKRVEFYQNAAMKWGTDNEENARYEYEIITGNFVDQVGFIEHPFLEWAGASPDGLVEDGLVEFKCPNTTTHIKYMLDGVVPDAYKNQMLWQMICCERKTWCDFVSYDPRMPEGLEIFKIRYEPTMEAMDELEESVNKFLTNVSELENQIRGIK
jgi:putative phage-type endonuclease